MENADGTATCDRCETLLPGAGIGYGLIVTRIDFDSGELVDRLMCYLNDCRGSVLAGLVNFTGPDMCACDGTPVLRTPSEAVVAADLDPGDPTQIRPLAFCYVGGCAERLLAQMGDL